MAEAAEWVRIPHGRDKTPGWWRDEDGDVMFRDPNGHEGPLENHTVWGPEATVSPNVRCTTPDCDFNEAIILEDYHG